MIETFERQMNRQHEYICTSEQCKVAGGGTRFYCGWAGNRTILNMPCCVECGSDEHTELTGNYFTPEEESK